MTKKSNNRLIENNRLVSITSIDYNTSSNILYCKLQRNYKKNMFKFFANLPAEFFLTSSTSTSIHMA